MDKDTKKPWSTKESHFTVKPSIFTIFGHWVQVHTNTTCTMLSFTSLAHDFTIYTYSMYNSYAS